MILLMLLLAALVVLTAWDSEERNIR
jgi:hypothetical protein